MSDHAHDPEHEAPGEWRKLAFLAAVSGGLGLLSLVANHFAQRTESGPMLKGDRFRVELRGKRHCDETFARGFGSVRHVAVNS